MAKQRKITQINPDDIGNDYPEEDYVSAQDDTANQPEEDYYSDFQNDFSDEFDSDKSYADENLDYNEEEADRYYSEEPGSKHVKKGHHRFEDHEAKPSKTPKKKKNNPLFIVIIVVAACVFIFAAYKLIGTLGKYKAANDTYDSVESIFETKATEAAEEEEDAPFVWDYNKLLEVNSESVGWIYCKGVLSYPIVQTFDENGNSKYLYTLIDGTPNDSGTLFVDTNQPEGLNGVYSIVYGHNMHDGSMFGCLQKYNTSSDSYYKEHPTMDIYIAEKHYVYNIIAAFTTPVDSFIYNYSITDEETYDNFINSAKANSLYDAYTGEIAASSNIITLSTCTPDNDENARFVVVLVRDHEVED